MGRRGLGWRRWETPGSKPGARPDARRRSSSGCRGNLRMRPRLAERASSERRMLASQWQRLPTPWACTALASTRSSTASSLRPTVEGATTVGGILDGQDKATLGGAVTPTEGLTTRRASSSWLMRTLRVAAMPSPSRSPPIRSASCAAPSRAPRRAFARNCASTRRPQSPAHLRREDAAYGRLLAALDELVIVPDPDVRDVLGDLAGIIDRSNEYRRVVCEHEALHYLLGQLGGGESR